MTQFFSPMLEPLHAAAMAALKSAYAPYSGFRVGAAILGGDGQIYAGANVENAAYPQSQCAEASAIGVMIVGGCISIAAVLIVSDGPKLISPCGGCRQRLVEFGTSDTPVYMADKTGICAQSTLRALLPFSFDAQQLKKT